MNLPAEYLLKQSDAAVLWLEKYTLTKGEFELHELRVHLKRIRAVLDFVAYLNLHPQKEKKLISRLHSIAHEAGFIRDSQLIIKWLKKNRYHLLLHESSIETKLDLSVELFINDCKKNGKQIRKIQNESLLYTKKMNNKTILKFLKCKNQFLFEALKKVKQEQWHDVRKAIKKFLYAIHWMQEKDKIKLLTIKKYNNLDLLQDAIGNWHDAVQIKLWLSNEQFFLNSNEPVRLQFNKSWEKTKKEIAAQEKAVIRILKNKTSGW